MPLGLPLRESILANVEETLLLVQSLRVESVRTNRSGVRAEVSGTYAGLVTRRYRVQVTTGGASGVAVVAVTDQTPAAQSALWSAQNSPSGGTADNGPSSQVVTSGTPFAVGALGAMLALTFTGALVVGDTWYVWAGPLASSLEFVTRAQGAQHDGPYAEISPPQGSVTRGPLPKRTEVFAVTVSAYLSRDAALPTAAELLYADLLRAVLYDETRGGNAVWTHDTGNLVFVPSDVRPRGGVDLRLEILYRTSDSDPRVA